MRKGKRHRQLAAEAGIRAREVRVTEQNADLSKQNLNQAPEMGQGSRKRRRKAEAKEAVARMEKTGIMDYAKDKIDEIAECERLVEFARQVEEGVHPRVKIPSHLHHLVSKPHSCC